MATSTILLQTAIRRKKNQPDVENFLHNRKRNRISYSLTVDLRMAELFVLLVGTAEIDHITSGALYRTIKTFSHLYCPWKRFSFFNGRFCWMLAFCVRGISVRHPDIRH